MIRIISGMYDLTLMAFMISMLYDSAYMTYDFKHDTMILYVVCMLCVRCYSLSLRLTPRNQHFPGHQ